MSHFLAVLLLSTAVIGSAEDKALNDLTLSFPTFHQTLQLNPGVQKDTANILKAVEQRKLSRAIKESKDAKPDGTHEYDDKYEYDDDWTWDDDYYYWDDDYYDWDDYGDDDKFWDDDHGSSYYHSGTDDDYVITDDGLVGYVVYQYYSGDSCTGDLTYSMGYASGTCVDLGEYSYQIIMDNVDCSTLKLVYYDGAGCIDQAFVSPLTGFSTCNMYLPGTFQASVSGYCSVGTAPEIKMDSSIVTVYEDAYGCGGYPVAFNAYATDLCVNIYGNVTYESAFDYVTCNPAGNITAYTYSSADTCEAQTYSAATITTLEQGCFAAVGSQATAMAAATNKRVELPQMKLNKEEVHQKADQKKQKKHHHKRSKTAKAAHSGVDSIASARTVKKRHSAAAHHAKRRPHMKEAGDATAGATAEARPRHQSKRQRPVSLRGANSEEVHGRRLTSEAPTDAPTMAPTGMPTVMPSVVPTVMPSVVPTQAPSLLPSEAPTGMPFSTVTPSVMPSQAPTATPSMMPTTMPTVMPTIMPTMAPSMAPTMMPTTMPTIMPSVWPSVMPTNMPTEAPTLMPTMMPTLQPAVTLYPSVMPSTAPSAAPTVHTESPSAMPVTHAPSVHSETPTRLPSASPVASTDDATSAVDDFTGWGDDDTPSDDFASAYFHIQLSCYVATPNPTLMPTSNVVSTATMSVVQVINGISYSTGSADADLYTSVLEQTIVQAVYGISTTSFTSFVPSGNGRRLSVSDVRVLDQSGTSTTLTYTVVSTTVGVTYDTMAADLDSSVSTGQFNNNLNSNAASSGATALIGCTSGTPETTDSVNTDDMTANNDDNSSSNSNGGLSDGALAGIVIAIVLLFVGCCVAYYFFVVKAIKPEPGPVKSMSFDPNSAYGRQSHIPPTENPVFGISGVRVNNVDDNKGM